MAKLRREPEFTEPRYDEVYEEFVRDFKEAEHNTSTHARDDRQIVLHTENGQIPVDEQKRLNIGPFNPVTGGFNTRRFRTANTARDWLRHKAEQEDGCTPCTGDPFEGVWDAMYVHECTRCGYRLSELKRRALQGSKLFLSSRCPRCDGDSWTDSSRQGHVMTGTHFRTWSGGTYGPWLDKNGIPCECAECRSWIDNKGLQPEPVRIYPSGVIWTDPKTGRDCFIHDPLVTKMYLNTLDNKLYKISPDGSWTEATGLKLVPYPGKIRHWLKSHQAYRIKRFIYGRPIERVARGAKKMEQWTKLAMAWIFIGAVLVTGLLTFGVLLVSLGLLIGITTTYRKLKTKIKSRLV